MRLRAEALVCGVLLALCPAAFAGEIYEATGHASWYGDELRGRKTANGERFDPDGLTAAHRTLPLSSYVEVTALDSGRTVIVRINDRGPYHGKRLIDLSHGAARKLGLVGHGARLVRVRRVSPIAVRATVAANKLERLRVNANWSPPKSTRATIPAGGGPYFIRVATFESRHRAASMAGRLNADIRTVDGLHQVRLGPFADMDKVNAALAPLAAKGYPDVRIVR